MSKKQLNLVPTTPKSFEPVETVHMPFLLPHSIIEKHERVVLASKIVDEWVLEEDLKCAICWGKIKTGDRTSTCPHCARKFHYDHLKVWLKTKSFCPSCRGDWFAARSS